MKTAIVHDWLVNIGGGEKVLEEILKIFPGDIFTLIANKEKMKNSFFSEKEIKTSFIKKLPFAKKKYRSYLPFFPLAIEQFDLSEYDLIISSSHCVAKGALSHANQLHICYCHSPIRYAWDLYHQYLKSSNLHKGIKGAIAKFFLHYLRNWDLNATPRVDHFIANSKFIAKRIKKVYRREAEVIYPPVDVDSFPLISKKQDYFVTASRLVPYKKIDLIVEAFSKMPEKRLVVIGDGPDMEKVKKKAKKNVEILGFVEDSKMKDIISKARAFVFAAIEDFGIFPVEAQASGTPVICLGKGGTKETIINNKTGIYFENQTLPDVIDAVNRFEEKKYEFDPGEIRKHSKNFSKEVFIEKMQSFVNQKYLEFLEKI